MHVHSTLKCEIRFLLNFLNIRYNMENCRVFVLTNGCYVDERTKFQAYVIEGDLR